MCSLRVFTTCVHYTCVAMDVYDSFLKLDKAVRSQTRSLLLAGHEYCLDNLHFAMYVNTCWRNTFGEDMPWLSHVEAKRRQCSHWEQPSDNATWQEQKRYNLFVVAVFESNIQRIHSLITCLLLCLSKSKQVETFTLEGFQNKFNISTASLQGRDEVRVTALQLLRFGKVLFFVFTSFR